MKILLVIGLILSSTAFAARTPNVITDKEAKEVLQELDNICGDSWCEGDYGYSFHNFSCSGSVTNATCELEFEMISSIGVKSSEKDTEITTKRVYPVTCSMSGLKREDIVSVEGNNISYGETLYEKVSLCISDMEEYIRKVEKNR